MSSFCCNTLLELITLSLFWPPLEVGVGYRGGSDFRLGRTGVGCGNNFCDSGGNDYTVRQIARTVRTASIVYNFESHMLVGTSLSSSENKCMAWVVLYSVVTWGSMRYACKYSAVYVIIN